VGTGCGDPLIAAPVVDLSIRFRRVHQRWLKMYRIDEKDAD